MWLSLVALRIAAADGRCRRFDKGAETRSNAKRYKRAVRLCFKSKLRSSATFWFDLVLLNEFLNNEMWLSLVERCVRDAEAAGSNPVISTKKRKPDFCRVCVFLFKLNQRG